MIARVSINVHSLPIIAWVVVWVMANWTAVAGAVGFTPLGDLPEGQSASSAFDVSGDGRVVVGRGSSGSLPFGEAFRWSAETGMVGLGDVEGGRLPFSTAFGVSFDGLVVVGSGDGERGFEAFRWTAQTGMVGLGDDIPGGDDLSFANAVSADGSVVVGFGDNFDRVDEAFWWSEQTDMVGLGTFPNGGSSVAEDVSADGAVVVGWGQMRSGTELINQAFRWTQQDGIIPLDRLARGASSRALGVSADGLVVVGQSDSDQGRQAFRWREQTGTVGLGVLPGGALTSMANAVSADGSVVVGLSGYSDANFEDGRAFVWDPFNGMRGVDDILIEAGIDLTGWKLFEATGVSADGTVVVGTGINPSGDREAWLAQLPMVIASSLDGDANGDGRVDASDLNLLALNWRQRDKVWKDGDFTGDGWVDAADLNVLALNWQQELGGSMTGAVRQDITVEKSVASNVPEPGAWSLLSIALAGSVTMRRAMGSIVNPRTCKLLTVKKRHANTGLRS